MRRLKGYRARWQRVYGVGQGQPHVEPLQSIVGETVEVWLKRCLYSQTSVAQSTLNHFFMWCEILLTRSHHSLLVSIPLILPTNSSILTLHLLPHLLLTCTRVMGNYHHHKLFTYQYQLDLRQNSPIWIQTSTYINLFSIFLGKTFNILVIFLAQIKNICCSSEMRNLSIFYFMFS